MWKLRDRARERCRLLLQLWQGSGRSSAGAGDEWDRPMAQPHVGSNELVAASRNHSEYTNQGE